jgi:hypothetical protein
MKILDIPQSGKRGLNVSQNGRYGQISRSLVIPTNPRSSAQVAVRTIFANVAAGWRGLTEAQRAAWTAAAKNYTSRTRCGTSGVLTGSQLYSKINCTLEAFGQEAVVVPPAKPAFGTLAPQTLVITNAAGVVAIKLTCPTAPGENTILRAAGPISAGRASGGAMNIIGTCPAVVQGSADITALYTAKYGPAAPGTKVFVSACLMQDGHESIPTVFSGIVPAGA